MPIYIQCNGVHKCVRTRTNVISWIYFFGMKHTKERSEQNASNVDFVFALILKDMSIRIFRHLFTRRNKL
jgi:hypothetical protein